MLSELFSCLGVEKAEDSHILDTWLWFPVHTGDR